MKYFHSIKISVFSKPEDDEEKIRNVLKNLIPFNMEDEKVEIKTQNVTGFNERKIKILEISLQKQRHTQEFFDFLMSKLNEEQKRMLLRQKESRLDENLDFFIRLDKDELLKDGFFITEFGNCFHVRISIAAFPKKRELGLKILDEILNQPIEE